LALAVVAHFRLLRREARGGACGGPLALLRPLFLALLIFLLGNKVLSPQYFVWLLPLAPLVPLSGRSRRRFLLGFALVCALTLGVFPLAGQEPIGEGLPPGGRFDHSGPTLAGALILSARSLALLALAVGLALATFRPDAGRRPGESAPRPVPVPPGRPIVVREGLRGGTDGTGHKPGAPATGHQRGSAKGTLSPRGGEG
jgi:hypothetical protein